MNWTLVDGFIDELIANIHQMRGFLMTCYKTPFADPVICKYVHDLDVKEKYYTLSDSDDESI